MNSGKNENEDLINYGINIKYSSSKEMSSKKAKIDYSAMENKAQQAQWKGNPPGPEQKELEHLFRSKKIGLHDTAQSVRAAYPLFSSFSPTVFASHFRKTRAKMGLGSMFYLIKCECVVF